MKIKLSALVFIAFAALYMVVIYKAPADVEWLVQLGWLSGIGMAAGLSLKWDGF